MRLLIVVRAYPNTKESRALMYVHVRNLYYVQHGIDVEVLNFSTQESYVIDGIKVFSFKDFHKNNMSYDCLVMHAPNLRNHLLFLLKYQKQFPKICFFFHGHEIVDYYKIYPKHYSFINKSQLTVLLENIYNRVKLLSWRIYFPQILYKSKFVFVSNFLENSFFRFVKVDRAKFIDRCHVINNSVGQIFEAQRYTPEKTIKYDFITVRSNLDASTYCIDLLVRVAKAFPEKAFLLVGKGSYFLYNERPKNICWIDGVLRQEELLQYINQAQYALMMTRNDTQGVMSCELATFGIPLITSDIPICHEIFDEYDGVKFVDNNCPEHSLQGILSEGVFGPRKRLYLAEQTLRKELELFELM